MKYFLIFLFSVFTLITSAQIKITTKGANLLNQFRSGRGSVYTNGQFSIDSSVAQGITIAYLRAVVLQTNTYYQIIDSGRTGIIKYIGFNTRADDGGIYYQDVAGNTFQRLFSGPIYAAWFGVKGDGVTNWTTQIQSFTNDANGLEGIFPGGTIICDSLTIHKCKSMHLRGQGLDSTTILSINSMGTFYYGDNTDVVMSDMTVRSNFVESAVDFGHALIFSEAHTTKRFESYRMKFISPYANATAIGFLVQASGFGGSFDGINFHDDIFDSIGATAFAFLNRDTTGIGALVASVKNGTSTAVIRNTGLDSGKNIRIVNCKIHNLGVASGATNGSCITLDGDGYNVVFDDNDIYNCLNVSLENTGFWYSEFVGNKFSGVFSGKLWQAWSFGGQGKPIYFNKISHNIELETMNNLDVFDRVSYSTFDHNTYRSDGQKFSGCNYNKMDHEYYFGAGFNSITLVSAVFNPSGYGTCIGNEFTNCTSDQSISSINISNIVFDGSQTKYNIVKDCKFYLGTNGGTYTSTKDTCSNLNYVYNPIINENPGFNALRIFTLSNSRDTAKGDDDLILYDMYKLIGNTANGSFYLQSNGHRKFTIWNATSFSDTVSPTTGGSFVIVPANTKTIIYSDSTNFVN